MPASYILNAHLSFPRIRRAEMEDLPAIHELHARSMRALGRRHYESRLIERFLETVGTLDERIVEDGTYLVAQTPGGEIVGSGGWSERVPRYIDAVEGRPAMGRGIRARIRSVFVHPEFARQGLGRCLMAGAEGAVRARGHRDIAIDATLAGVPLSIAMGYRNVAPLVARLPGGESMTFIHLRKQLVRTIRARAA